MRLFGVISKLDGIIDLSILYALKILSFSIQLLAAEKPSKGRKAREEGGSSSSYSFPSSFKSMQCNL